MLKNKLKKCLHQCHSCRSDQVTQFEESFSSGKSLSVNPFVPNAPFLYSLKYQKILRLQRKNYGVVGNVGMKLALTYKKLTLFKVLSQIYKINNHFRCYSKCVKFERRLKV